MCCFTDHSRSQWLEKVLNSRYDFYIFFAPCKPRHNITCTLCNVIGKRHLLYIYCIRTAVQAPGSTFCTFILKRLLIFSSCTNFVCNMISQWENGHGKICREWLNFFHGLFIDSTYAESQGFECKCFWINNGRFVIDVWEYRCCMYTRNMHTYSYKDIF